VAELHAQALSSLGAHSKEREVNESAGGRERGREGDGGGEAAAGDGAGEFTRGMFVCISLTHTRVKMLQKTPPIFLLFFFVRRGKLEITK
jgi:hypothetical protein